MSDSVRPHRRQPTRLPRPWDSPGKNTGVGCHFLLPCMKVKSESEVAQSYPTLSDPMDCSLTGSSVHGIFQARVLEWGAIAFSDHKKGENGHYEILPVSCYWDRELNIMYCTTTTLRLFGGISETKETHYFIFVTWTFKKHIILNHSSRPHFLYFHITIPHSLRKILLFF